jgi:hypothetical protein
MTNFFFCFLYTLSEFTRNYIVIECFADADKSKKFSASKIIGSFMIVGLFAAPHFDNGQTAIQNCEES